MSLPVSTNFETCPPNVRGADNYNIVPDTNGRFLASALGSGHMQIIVEKK